MIKMQYCKRLDNGMLYIDTIIRTCLNSYYIVLNEGAVGKTYDHTSCQIIYSFHFIPKNLN